MVRKNIKWNQKEKQQKIFENIKKRFIIKLVLVILDLDKEMRVKVNILDFAIEEVFVRIEDGRLYFLFLFLFLSNFLILNLD